MQMLHLLERNLTFPLVVITITMVLTFPLPLLLTVTLKKAKLRNQRSHLERDLQTEYMRDVLGVERIVPSVDRGVKQDVLCEDS